jgi:hypothetical protein
MTKKADQTAMVPLVQCHDLWSLRESGSNPHPLDLHGYQKKGQPQICHHLASPHYLHLFEELKCWLTNYMQTISSYQ